MKYFYKCPIEAAYMAKHFKMQFGIKHHGKLIWDWQDMLNIPHPAKSSEDILEDYPAHTFGSLYIHPNNLDSLKPQTGDLCSSWHKAHPTMGIPYMLYGIVESDHGGLHSGGRYHSFAEDIRIIQRDGKPFFWPESEAA